jgi:DNA-binding MarR family transcriptional regulator
MSELSEFLLLDPATAKGGGGRTLNLDKSPTFHLVVTANRFTRSASRVYQARYGIGAMEWRMLVMLTQEPGAGVARAVEVIGIDKAAVSRALGRLEDKGLARAEAPSTDPRRRAWRLTADGHALHDRMLQDALDRQERILEGLSLEDVASLTRMLRHIASNIEALDACGEFDGPAPDS